MVNVTSLPGGPQGSRLLRIQVERKGEVPWRPQISHPGIAVKKGAPYTLSGWVRAVKPGSIAVNCMMAHEPWENLGLYTDVSVGPEWKQFRFTFFAEKDDANARITVTGLEPGVYELARFSFRPGGIVGLAPDQRLEDDSVPIVRKRGPIPPEQARADWADFMWDVEYQYWMGMYRFLKEELGVKALVSGTQLGYGPTHIQAQLDYLDDHRVLEPSCLSWSPLGSGKLVHPECGFSQFPPGTLGALAARRVVDRPYTVSEYNHPAPMFFAAEGFPMIAAFAAFRLLGRCLCVHIFSQSRIRDSQDPGLF